MADITTSKSELLIDTYFVDGDTRTITIKNPKAEITSTELSELNTFFQQSGVIIGDKTGATFGKIKSVKRKITDEVNIDID